MYSDGGRPKNPTRTCGSKMTKARLVKNTKVVLTTKEPRIFCLYSRTSTIGAPSNKKNLIMPTVVAERVREIEERSDRCRDSMQNDESGAGRSRTSDWNDRQWCFRSPSPVPGSHLQFVKLVGHAGAAVTSSTTDDESSVTTAGTESDHSLSSSGSSSPTSNSDSSRALEGHSSSPSILKVSTQSESLAREFCSSSRRRSEERISRGVSFSKVYIYLHQYIVGDNPSVSSGAPVTIAWTSESASCLPIDFYEDGKLGKERRCYRNGLLRLDETRREKLLKSQGFSKKATKKAIKAVKAIQDSRRRTMAEQLYLIQQQQQKKQQRKEPAVTCSPSMDSILITKDRP